MCGGVDFIALSLFVMYQIRVRLISNANNVPAKNVPIATKVGTVVAKNVLKVATKNIPKVTVAGKKIIDTVDLNKKNSIDEIKKLKKNVEVESDSVISKLKKIIFKSKNSSISPLKK